MKILLIDDDQQFSILLQEAIKPLKSLISLDWIKKFDISVFKVQYDIYIVDNRFNGEFKGKEIVKNIRDKFPDARILLVSSYITTELLTQVGDYNIAGFIDKNQVDIVPIIAAAISDYNQDKQTLFNQTQGLKESQQQLKTHAVELQKSQDALEEFAYVVSHDLKAPLRSVNNLSQWIVEDFGSQIEDELKDKLSLLRDRVLKMQSLIDGVLEYSRVGRTDTNREFVSTLEIVREVLSVESTKEFDIIVDQNLPNIYGNPIRVSQVFANLVSNALKHHGKDKGKITIGFKELEDFYQFNITDDGKGIDSRFYKRIFELFITLQPKDKKRGIGAGLTLVKKIVEQEGGMIWVTSEVDKGSVFSFTWPKNKERNDESI